MARHNQKVKLKRSDLEVTRLSLGTAPLGGLFKAVTDADGDELLNTALDVGINYFDTAPQYGHGVAEIRLGKALRNAKVPFVVETKVGRVLRHDPNAETFPWFPDAPRDLVPVFDYSPDGIRRAFDEWKAAAWLSPQLAAARDHQVGTGLGFIFDDQNLCHCELPPLGVKIGRRSAKEEPIFCELHTFISPP